MADPTTSEGGKRRGMGCAILGWVLVALLAAFLGWFGYKVWYYYGKLKSGEVVELPQYRERLTAVGGTTGPFTIPPEALVTTDQPTLGPDDAKLTVTIFADFECPYSKDAFPGYRALMAKYDDRVRFVYRDYPLETIHPSALQAAVAGECAREQDRFWVYHDKLFTNAPDLAFDSLVRYAEEAGLDTKAFETCLAEGRHLDDVQLDANAARSLGVRGTPTFFFNGRPVEGAIPQEALDAVIQRMLN